MSQFVKDYNILIKVVKKEIYFKSKGFFGMTNFVSHKIRVDNHSIHHNRKFHMLTHSLIKHVKVKLRLFVIEQEFKPYAPSIKPILLKNQRILTFPGFARNVSDHHFLFCEVFLEGKPAHLVFGVIPIIINRGLILFKISK